MLARLWLKEFWRATAILIVCLLFGWATGRVTGFLMAGLLLILAWHLNRLHHFARWLVHGGRPQPHLADDIWGELYYRVHKLKARARKRERKLRELVERYRASAAALPDAALVIRSDNAIEWMNEAAVRLLGFRPGLDVGQRIDNLIRHPDFVSYLHAGDYSEALELPSPVAAGKVLQLHIVPYGDRQRLLVARDITKERMLEAMRRDFIANVSHELSTPLTVISGYLESLGESPPSADGPSWTQALSQMRQQTERMRNLVDDLLQLTRLETEEIHGPEQEVDVSGLIESLLAGLQPPDGVSRHEITLEADRTLWLRGVGRDLHSAFANLIRNAMQYTPDGGRIGIRWYADADGAHFEVRDTGIGIPPRAIPRLTERFYRVDAGRSRSVGGTGLGLSIVKHVLKAHDAGLRIESMPGEGSTFTCDFPPARLVRRVAAGGPA